MSKYQLHNISKRSEESIYKDLWDINLDGYDPNDWLLILDEFVCEKAYNQEADAQSNFNINADSTIKEWMDFYSKKSMKVIVNKNDGSRAKRNQGKSLHRIDICFHDKNRVSSNTTFTFFANKDKVIVLWKNKEKSRRFEYTNVAGKLWDAINSLKNPLIFESKPHLPAKGSNRVHTQYYHQKIPKIAFDELLEITFYIHRDQLFNRLLLNICYWPGANLIYYDNWPINRLPISSLEPFYHSKKFDFSLSNVNKKSIVDNGLILDINNV